MIPKIFMSKELEQKTVLDFKQGDEKAFQLVFRAYYPSLVLFARKITGSQEEARGYCYRDFF